MIAALVKALAQLGDRRLRAVVWRGAGVAAVAFAVLWALSWWGVDQAGTVAADRLAADGLWRQAIEVLVGVGGFAAVLVASFLLFPAVMGLAQMLFLEDAAARVEARHYPDLPATGGQPLWAGIRDGLALAVVTVAANLVVLPVYLLLPFLNLVVFYALNGYLLGREYFELVAGRRMARADVQRLRRRHRGRVAAAGVPIAIMMTIPGLNLLAPVVATAFMVHVFERLRRRAAPAAAATAAVRGEGRKQSGSQI